MYSIGVDGCRAGWFWVGLDGDTSHFGKVASLSELFTRDCWIKRVLVDIPIGMTSENGEVRTCDHLARKHLGSRACTVFTAPCREAIAAPDYKLACDRNQAVTGRRLSRQCWGIVPKINEVDLLLRSDPQARALVRESHPELCFAAINQGAPLLQNKKTDQGFEVRLALLTSYQSDARALVDQALAMTRRSEVARDDIVDALMLAATASLPNDQLRTIPAEPTIDSCGLPMEMILPSRYEMIDQFE